MQIKLINMKEAVEYLLNARLFGEVNNSYKELVIAEIKEVIQLIRNLEN